MLYGDDGSMSLRYLEGLTVQLDYFDCLVLESHLNFHNNKLKFNYYFKDSIKMLHKSSSRTYFQFMHMKVSKNKSHQY